jgi:hypothetical protein
MKARLDMKKIARELRAERRGKVTAAGGNFGAMQALADVEACFRVPAGSGRSTGAPHPEPGVPLAREGARRELHEE